MYYLQTLLHIINFKETRSVSLGPNVSRGNIETGSA
jgi:hypothetical protein